MIVVTLKNGRATERPVKVGIANTQFYELKEGLQEGEKVLTGPVRKLMSSRNARRSPCARAPIRRWRPAERRPRPRMMDIREPFKAAVVSLKANKMRSLLTTLGIVIGVAAVNGGELFVR